MTSDLHFEIERATAAHSAAIALITTTLGRGSPDVRRTLTAFVEPPADSDAAGLLEAVRSLADIIEVLAWHAGSNLVRAEGDVDGALTAIRSAAIGWEITLGDSRGKEPS